MRKTKDNTLEMTDGKILTSENNVSLMRRLADTRIERGDYVGALGFLFRVLENEDNLDVIMDIADVYADAEMYELSNKFWFIYLSKAPEERQGVAYEELGINFFYMDNLYLSSYYFHKKIAVDGYLSHDGLDKEIADYFSDIVSPRDGYKIAYPPERTDYTNAIKEAKRATVMSDYATAERLLSSVPEGCPQYGEALGELAMLKFIMGDTDGGIEVSRKHLNSLGDNLTAYSNLSSFYFYKHDLDKSRYYYINALCQPLGDDVIDYYKLATCSLEQGEHEKATELMSRIIRERLYDTNIRYLYGLALINCGKYELAAEELSFLSRLKPWDNNLKYYASLASKLQNNGDKNGLLPLEYFDGLPEKEETKRLATLKKLPNIDKGKLNRALKDDYVFECVTWGLRSSEESVSKLCVLILITCSLKKATDALNEVLIDPDAPLHIKEIVLYVLVINGTKKSLPLVKLNFFTKVKPKKLRFEKMPDCEVYFIAYSLCFSRLAFSSVTNLDKIAFSAERVFKRLSALIPPDQLATEELAALIASECGYKEIHEKSVTKIFGADKNKYKKLKSIYNGEEQC